MVRFKNRYFVCEYVQENQEKEFSERDLLNEIRDQVQYHFGDFGSARIQFSFQVKYLNTVSRLFILRVARDYKNIIWNTLLFMNMFRGLPIKIKVLGCSGIIRFYLRDFYNLLVTNAKTNSIYLIIQIK